ncbi:MAG: gephyrin-like molybdotransferase Glp [Pseudomonadota bacterium]
MPDPMLSVAEALARVLALIAPVGVEEVALRHASGRVLARTLTARRTQPPVPVSAMDGYALRAADAQPGASLRLIGTAQAGDGFDGTLGAGEAVRIFTGAPLPDGADTILIQEVAAADGPRIAAAVQPEPGQHIRPAGGDFHAGATIDAPQRIGPHLLALMAAMNIERVPVARRPVIALIPTGDELVWPGTEPGRHQIVTSNNFGLAALLEQAGAQPRLLPIARDVPEALRAALSLAEGADMIVTLGGASVGAYDLVQQVFVAAGMALDFWRIAMRPGKPLMAGRIGGVPMVGLPGNPVSAMVCGHLFLRPAIDAALGLPAGPLARQTALLDTDLGANGPREHYMRAELRKGRIRPFERQDSSLLTVLARANALMIRPPHQPALSAGTRMEYVSLDL